MIPRTTAGALEDADAAARRQGFSDAASARRAHDWLAAHRGPRLAVGVAALLNKLAALPRGLEG